jgi:HemY protein
MWMAQGMTAVQEPDWSDLDPEGRAFAYQASDWARLVATFAETGELIHPRHERRERTLSELPELPLAYLEAAPAFSDGLAVEPVLYPLPEGHDDEADPPPPPPPRAGSRRAPSRRRLASGPRPAK